MRQIKGFILSIKRLFEITELARISKREYANDILHVSTLPGRVRVRHLPSKNQIVFSTSTEHYVNMCQVHVVKFGIGNTYETSEIDLSIEDKNDYFNYAVQNEPGRLTLEDIEVLKEIRERALKVLNNETSVH